jgi:hypothetical protein
MSCAKTCLRKHYFEYELGLRKLDTGTPLRVGSAFHLALETADQHSISDAITAVRDNYASPPEWVTDLDAWLVEREMVERLFLGHTWRWQDETFEVVATEQAFDLPLINPDTGHASKNWRMAGKIDRIVRMADGRLAVQEYKTTSEAIDTASDYWQRLRLDQQISMYVVAARDLGHDVDTVIYDVTRKPTIRPKKPVKADVAKWPAYYGETMVGEVPERESPTMYGSRLSADIESRPDYYFARREIPRLESDLDEFRYELWQQAKQLREAQLHGRWFRNTQSCSKPYRCTYFDICANGIDPAEGAPVGFRFVDDVHPELSPEEPAP